MTIPCVFIHTGRTWEWLGLTMAQARKFNEQVVLLDDDDLPEYGHDVARFHAAYENYSTNPAWFEEHAFWRWLILNEYCQKNNIDVVFHLDSDTMMFADVNAEYKAKFRRFPVSLVVGNCGATCYFTREHLAGLTELLLKTYIDKNDDFMWLKNLYTRMQAQGLDGGACDMVLLDLYLKRNQIAFGEMTDIRVPFGLAREKPREAYDHTMSEPVPGGYRLSEGIKEIEFKHGLPYATIDKTGEQILMRSLHFQGTSELRLAEFVRRIEESTLKREE